MIMTTVEELGRNKYKYKITNSYTGCGILLPEGKQNLKDEYYKQKVVIKKLWLISEERNCQHAKTENELNIAWMWCNLSTFKNIFKYSFTYT